MKKCPFTRKECMKDQCMLWQCRSGYDEHGNDKLRADCAFNFAVDIALEGARNSYSTGQAVEIFREDMKKQNDGIASIMLAGSIGALPGKNNTRMLEEDKS